MEVNQGGKGQKAKGKRQKAKVSKPRIPETFAFCLLPCS